MIMSVTTVLGKIKAGQLGITAPHEHCLIDIRSQFRPFKDKAKNILANQKVGINNIDTLRRNPLAIKDNLLIDDVKNSIQELKRFKEVGGRTLVDVTSVGLKRKPKALRDISRATGVHIVAGCGYYYHETHPKNMGKKTVDDIKKEMVHDIEVGIDGTGIRAGIIGEIGISDTMHPDERKVLAAAAKAQEMTGVAISVHIFPWAKRGRPPLGLEALKILLKNGACPGRVAIGHADVAIDINLAYCKEIARRGAYVEFDNFGHEFYVDKANRAFIPGPFATDVQRVIALKTLIDAGYGSRVLLSTDICHKNLLHRYGGWSYDHVITNIVSMMHEYKISDRQVHSLLIENPRNFLDVN
jgi:phosphotriesterase-related protein